MARAVGAVLGLLHDPRRRDDRVHRHARDHGGFGADVDAVVWVTSAYLLAYAVPLLITGRLGDRFGPSRIYLVGLAVFTLASLWCGLTGSIGGLIVARVVQGLGASVMSPQTMAVITRTFPAEPRGRAMSLWGAVAGRRDAGRADPRRRARRRRSAGSGSSSSTCRSASSGSCSPPGWSPRCRRRSAGSTSSAWRSGPSACSCWSSASRRGRPSRGAPVGVVADRRRRRGAGAVRGLAGPRHRSRCSRWRCSATATSPSPTSRSPPSGSASRRRRSRSCSTPRACSG